MSSVVDARVAAAPSDEVPMDGWRRQLGGLVDGVVSVGLFVLAVVIARSIDVGSGPTRLVSVIVVFLALWGLDIALYVVPMTRWGASIGNVVSGVRTVDATTRGPLSRSRSARRYVARRRLLKHAAVSVKRDLRRREQVVAEASDPFTSPISLTIASAMIELPEPAPSPADLAVGSVVVRGRSA